MAISASEFKEAFIARVKAAREARYTQQEIADLLGIPQSKYKQYEKRSLLPHVLIPKFCTATGKTMEELFAPPSESKSIARKPRRRAA